MAPYNCEDSLRYLYWYECHRCLHFAPFFLPEAESHSNGQHSCFCVSDLEKLLLKEKCCVVEKKVFSTFSLGTVGSVMF